MFRHFRAAAKAADALPFDSGFAGQIQNS